MVYILQDEELVRTFQVCRIAWVSVSSVRSAMWILAGLPRVSITRPMHYALCLTHQRPHKDRTEIYMCTRRDERTYMRCDPPELTVIFHCIFAVLLPPILQAMS
ncbi:hypothetical protein SCHPADRAFT_437107 [Schizopora paradoxa]|uniref:Uncharacterized protein n=1 Tax=Schizopora paradoxa TaxID=27342 RepID=A0A0H2S594_9AGAM|nr:hypothetical protein SCHPADRAFT_437107 [Schizopora paradoxa]